VAAACLSILASLHPSKSYIRVACLSPGSMNDDLSGSDATSSSAVGSGGGRDPDRLLTSIEGRGWGGGGFMKEGEEGCRIVCFSSDIVEAYSSVF
jgi:hypothetical protein